MRNAACALALLAIVSALALTGCKQMTTASPGPGGSVVIVGGLPAGIGTRERPYGVIGRGVNAGQVAWVAAGAALSAAEAEHLHDLIGTGELASTPDDPCNGKSNNVKMWSTVTNNREIFIDCLLWRLMMHLEGTKLGRNPLRTLTTCVSNIIRYGITEDHISYIAYDLSPRGFLNIDADTGRILVIRSPDWMSCRDY